MSEHAITLLPEGTNVNVVDPANPAALSQRLHELTADAFYTAFMQTNFRLLDSKAVESGATQRASKADLIAFLKNAAREAMPKGGACHTPPFRLPSTCESEGWIKSILILFTKSYTPPS